MPQLTLNLNDEEFSRVLAALGVPTLAAAQVGGVSDMLEQGSPDEPLSLLDRLLVAEDTQDTIFVRYGGGTRSGQVREIAVDAVDQKRELVHVYDYAAGEPRTYHLNLIELADGSDR